MSTQAEAPAAPDLSRLEKDMQLNAAVARTQGAYWRPCEEPHSARMWEVDRGDGVCWELVWERGGLIVWTYSGSWFCATGEMYHDYAGDPSAWGALMEKERVVPVASDDGWYGIDLVDVIHDPTNEGNCMALRGPQFLAHNPGTAVSAAVLSKYGVDPSPYIGD